MKQCIFLASNEGDLLIHAGISSLIREYAPEQRTVLILPKYPRVYRRADDYRHFFDRIIEVDGIYFTQNPKRLFRNILAIRKLQRSLIPYMNHLFFLFDVYTLVELVIYSWVRRQRDARLITVTAFEGDEIDFSNLRTSFIGTLSKSLYSLPLSGHLFFEYRVAKSENAGLNYFAGKCDLQLNINR
jgi:hypothetical protein